MRIRPLVHSIIRNTDYCNDPNGVIAVSDYNMDQNMAIWIIQYPDLTISNPVEFLNNLENDIINYNGRVMLYSLDDGMNSPYQGIKESILNRIDAWVVYSMHGDDINKYNKNICEKILHKYILIPRYLIDFIPPKPADIQSEYKIYFKGSYHDGNNRINPLLMIKNHHLLNQVFVGGLFPIDNVYIPEIIYSPRISQEDSWWETMRYKISLCLPGNSYYCFRHVEAMAYENAIITPNLKVDGEWMYSDMIIKQCYTYSDDLSDFTDVCMYAIQNKDETYKRAKKLNDIFESFFRLSPDLGYPNTTWLPIQNKLQNLNIDV